MKKILLTIALLLALGAPQLLAGNLNIYHHTTICSKDSLYCGQTDTLKVCDPSFLVVIPHVGASLGSGSPLLTGTPAYVWRKNGVVIYGTSGNTLVINSPGTYTCFETIYYTYDCGTQGTYVASTYPCGFLNLSTCVVTGISWDSKICTSGHGRGFSKTIYEKPITSFAIGNGASAPTCQTIGVVNTGIKLNPAVLDTGLQYNYSLTPSTAGTITSTGIYKDSAYILWNNAFTGVATIDATIAGCLSANYKKSISLNLKPTVLAPNPILLQYNNTEPTCMLTSSGATTKYTSSGSNLVGFAWSISDTNAGTISGTGIATVNWKPNYVGTVTISLRALGCNGPSAPVSRSFTIKPLPTVTAVATPTFVCNGGTSVVVGSGALSYTYQQDIIYNAISNNVAFVPAYNSNTYTVTGIGANGCTNTNTVTVNKNNFIVNAYATPRKILCPGQATMLGLSGNTTVYSASVSGGVPIATFFAPTATNTYTITGTDVIGCTASSTVTVYYGPPKPSIIDTTICGVGSHTIVTKDSVSALWYRDSTLRHAFNIGSTLQNNFSTDTTYYIKSFNSTSTNTRSVDSTTPIVTSASSMFAVTASTNLHIKKLSAFLSAGNNTVRIYYRPDNFVTSGSANSSVGWTLLGITPISVANAGITAIPIPLDVKMLNGETFSFYIYCSGGNIINTSGVGATVGTIISNLPQLSVRYGLGGNGFFSTSTNSRKFLGSIDYEIGCESGFAPVNIKVRALPTIAVNSTREKVCFGDSLLLQASSSDSVYWNNGIANNTSILPNNNSIYTATAMNSFGCTASTTQQIVLRPKPYLKTVSNEPRLCWGEIATVKVDAYSSSDDHYAYHYFPASLNIPDDAPLAAPWQTPGTPLVDSILISDLDTNTLNNFLKVSVNMNLFHEALGDLQIQLISPNGTIVNLLDRVGTTNMNAFGASNTMDSLYTLTFTPDATNAINTSNTLIGTQTIKPSAGFYGTAGNMNTYNAPAFANYNGYWKLKIIDGVQSFSGRLKEWGINIYRDVDTVDAFVLAQMQFNFSANKPFTTTSFGEYNSNTAYYFVDSLYTQMAVENIYGCIASSYDSIEIVRPVPNFTGWPSTVCNGDSVLLNVGGPNGFYENYYNANEYYYPNQYAVFNETKTMRAYFVEFIGSRQCTNAATFIFTVPMDTIQIIASDTAICEGDNITITANNGTNLQWSNGVLNGVSFIPTSTSTYTVTGIGNSGCTATATITIVVHPKPIVDYMFVKNLECTQANNANINVIVANAFQGGFTYAWQPAPGFGITNPIATGLATGTYTCTITSPQGCVTDTSATISVVGSLQANLTLSTPVSCNNDSNGVLHVNFNGSTSDTNTTYVFIRASDFSISTGSAVLGLRTLDSIYAGTYYLQTFTADGCVSRDTLVVNNPAVINDTNSIINCTNYFWVDTLLTSSAVLTKQFTSYRGCDSVVTISYTKLPAPIINYNILADTICVGAIVTLIADPQDTNVHTTWWNDATAGNQISSSTMLIDTPSADKNYYVNILDLNNGCVLPRQKISIKVNQKPTINIAVSNNNICANDSFSIINSSVQFTYDSNANATIPSLTCQPIIDTVIDDYKIKQLIFATDTANLSIRMNNVTAYTGPNQYLFGNIDTSNQKYTLLNKGYTLYRDSTYEVTPYIYYNPYILPFAQVYFDANRDGNFTASERVYNNFPFVGNNISPGILHIEDSLPLNNYLMRVCTFDSTGFGDVNNVFDPCAPQNSDKYKVVDYVISIKQKNPIHYTWTSTVGYTTQGNSIAYTNGLAGGNYTVSVVATNTNNCSAQANLPIVVNANPNISIGNSTQVCPNDSVILTASSPQTNNIVWSMTHVATNYTFANNTAVQPLYQIVYTAKATDSNGCIAQAGIAFTELAAPSIVNVSAPSFCTGDTAIASVTSSQGASAARWFDANKNLLSSDTIYKYIGTASTILNVRVLDSATGCASPYQAFLTNAKPKPPLNLQGPNYKVCDGAQVGIYNAGPYLYQDTINANPSIVAAACTTQNLFVIPGTEHKCFDSISINGVTIINDSIGAYVDYTSNAAITNLYKDTTYTLTIYSGVGKWIGAFLDYDRDGIFNNFDETLQALTQSTSGITTITIDKNYYQYLNHARLRIFAADTIAYEPCTGFANYAFYQRADYAVNLVDKRPIDLQWTIPNGGNFNSPNSVDWYNGLAAGTYSFTAASTLNGCTNSQTINIEILQPQSLQIFTSANACEGDIVQFLAGGAGIDSNSIEFSNFNVFAYQQNGSFGLPDSSIVYYVLGTDTNFCQVVDSIQFTINAKPDVVANITQVVSCPNTSILLYGSGAQTYTWSNGVLNNEYSVAAANGVYTVIGTDANGCTNQSEIYLGEAMQSNQLALAINSNANSIIGIETMSQVQPDNSTLNYVDLNCDLIASINDAFGGNVLGTVNAQVKVDTNIPTNAGNAYSPRWFSITPTNQGAAAVTLYQTQEDFDRYNVYATANSLLLLPTNPNDNAGIANIKVLKINGGNLGSGTNSFISPTVNFNTANNYWELSFGVTGFSQFYIGAQSSTPLSIGINLNGVVANNTNQLQWPNAISDVKNYEVQKLTNNIFTTIATTASSNFVDEKIEFENIYRIKANLNNGTSVYSNTIKLNHTLLAPIITIYPNPTNGILNITYNTTTSINATIKILDATGRIVKQIETVFDGTENTMDISELAGGIYVVEIDVDGAKWKEKLVKE